MLLSCIIDTEDKIDVAIIDTPNAFIQKRVENEMEDIKTRGFLVDLLLEIDPDFYGPFVTTDNKGKNVIIVKCMNAIYGTMVDSLLY